MVTEATAKPESMDPIAESDVRISVNRIVKLLQSGIFDPANHENIFLESAFIELMIHLRDLIEKTKNHAEEITFTDDIVVNSYVKHCMFMTPSRRCAMRAAISRHTNGFWESLNTEEHST